MAESYTVGEIAKIAHVSVRALHHYDEIGLLAPSARTAAGYRLYGTHDLQRLQQILFYRELEFGLDDIAAMLADPGQTAEDHLRRQHKLLRDGISRRHELLGALQKEMEAREMGIALTPEEQFEIFGTSRFENYQEEAEQRWGETDAWKQSQRRTATYTKDDWVQIKAEADANIAAFAAAITAGEPSDGEHARELAEQHRQHIARWFYDCGHAMHRGIGELYVSDPRYLQDWEGTAPGFSQYVRDAFAANAAAHGA